LLARLDEGEDLDATEVDLTDVVVDAVTTPRFPHRDSAG